MNDSHITRRLTQIHELLADLDVVDSATLRRRCGISRTTLSRWRHGSASMTARGDLRRVPAALPAPHLYVANAEYWVWPLLVAHDPQRFPAGVGAS